MIMDHLIVCNNKQKATQKQQMKSSHKKGSSRQLIVCTKKAGQAIHNQSTY